MFNNTTFNFSTLIHNQPNNSEYYFIFTTLTYGFVVFLSIISTTSVNLGIGLLFLNQNTFTNVQFGWILINSIINLYLNFRMLTSDKDNYLSTLVLLLFYFLSTISLCNFYIKLRLIEYIILLILFQPHFVIILIWANKVIKYYKSKKYLIYKNHNCVENCEVCPCSICYEKIDKIVYLNCKHSIHYKCLNNWLELNKFNTFCPICRTNIIF